MPSGLHPPRNVAEFRRPYNPLLNAGAITVKRLADELGLHMFDCTNTGSAFVEHMTR
jgi:glutaminase